MARFRSSFRVMVVVVAGGAVAVLLGLAFLLLPGRSTAAPTRVAVVDAGSSGSRIAVFESNSVPLDDPVQVMSEKPNVPALSTFENDPELAGPQGVGPLLDLLEDFIRSEGWDQSAMPVSVLATAGMRNVERRNPTAAAAIIDSVATYISSRGYAVGEVSIMSGEREALYAWVDLNAAQGTLADGDNSLGIVEEGGASVQVAFQSPQPVGPGVRTTTIGGLTFHVVAVSYLGLGQNDARSFMRDLGSGGAECFPNNAPTSEPIFFEEKSGSPLRSSTANFQIDQCQVAYETVITQQGSSEFNLANNDQLGPKDIRSLPGFDTTEFLGAASIAYNMANFKLAPGPGLGTRFREVIRATCTGSDAWASVAALGAGTSDPNAGGLCANGVYSYVLAYGAGGVMVPEDRLRVDVELKGDSPSWSKGFALTQLNP